jgi:hypothetical protein
LSTSAKRGRPRKRSKLLIVVVLVITIVTTISIIIVIIFLDVVLILRRSSALAMTVRRKLIRICRTSLIIKLHRVMGEAQTAVEEKTQYQPTAPYGKASLACHAPAEH